jgi:two-component system response regulator QseB
MAKVLLVEDDKNLCRIISDMLGFEQFVVEVVHDGQEGAERLKLYEYDLIILDWELPKLPGVDVCTRYRAAGGKSSVLMLTGKSAIADKESGFDAGADDYLTKPFDSRELIARIRALLRRSPNYKSTILSLGDLSLDVAGHRFQVGGVDVALLPKEFLLMEFLLKHPEEVFSQEALLNKVWSSESEASVLAIRSCVKRIRKKLEDSGSRYNLKAVYGVGYRLEANADNGQTSVPPSKDS